MPTTTCPMRREADATARALHIDGAAGAAFSPPSENLGFPLVIVPPRGTQRASRQARVRARKLLALKLDFIADAGFAVFEDAEPCVSGVPDEGRWLSAPEEAALFRRMNYLKYRANVMRSLLDPSCPCEALMCEIERLLAEASGLRNQLMCTFIRLVGSIARRFIDSQHAYEELVSEGCMPLLRAIVKFDFRRGYRFSTYATHAIQRHFFRLFSKVSKERARYAEAAVDKLENGTDGRRRRSRNEAQMLAADASIQRMIGRLDQREQYIVQSRYGLKRGEGPQTLKAIGQRLGVCKERVRQLEQRAICKLRDMAEEAELEAPAG